MQNAFCTNFQRIYWYFSLHSDFFCFRMLSSSKKAFLFYKVDPALIKTILLHSALCWVPQGKKRKYLHILRKLQNIMDQRHTILKRCNSDPHAAKSQCIRFQPDILLCDRHIDLCHILNRQSLFPIYRNDHNRCTCCTSGIGSGFGKLQDLLLSQHKIPTAADYMRLAPAYLLSGSEGVFPSLRVYLHIYGYLLCEKYSPCYFLLVILISLVTVHTHHTASDAILHPSSHAALHSTVHPKTND